MRPYRSRRCLRLLSKGVLSRTPLWILSMPVMAIAIVMVYAYFFLPPYWPKHFGAFDVHYLFGPTAFFMDTSIHNGEFALWNPLSFCGTPFAANPQTTVFYPFHLVRSLLTGNPTPWSSCVGIELVLVLHMLIAGAGSVALAREYRLSVGACFVTAVVYVFGPYSVVRAMEHWTIFAVTAWLPLLLLLVRRAVKAHTLKGKIYYACESGLVFGMCTLAGFPQATFYVALTVVLFSVIDGLVHVKRADFAEPRRVAKGAVKVAAVLAIMFGLGALVAAAMLLPAWEFSGLSSRLSTSGLPVGTAPQDLSFRHLFKCLVVYPGATTSEQGCRAAGIGALLLAVGALTHERRRTVALFGLVFLILTDCTLGPPFPFSRLVEWADYFQFSSPWRANIASSLPFAMLVGFGVDAVSVGMKSRFGNWARTCVLVAVGCISLGVLSRWLGADSYFPVSKTVLFVPIITLIAVSIAGWFKRPQFWRFELPMLVFAEIMIWNSYFVPYYMSRRLCHRSTSGFGEVREIWQDNYRGTYSRPNWTFFSLKPIINGYGALYIHRVRQTLCAPRNEGLYYRNLRDWEVVVENHRGNLFLKRSFWLARQYVKGPLPGKESLFPSATTVFLPDFDSSAIPEIDRSDLPASSVSENTTRIPVADKDTLASLVKPRRNGTGSWEIRLPAFNINRIHSTLYLRYTSDGTVDVYPYFWDSGLSRYEKGKRSRATNHGDAEHVLDIPLPDLNSVETTLVWKGRDQNLQFTEAYVLQDQSDEDRLIKIISRKANSVELVVNDLPDSRVLTFIDAAYPGWKAYVDSEPVPIHLANDAFKAIVVPPGTHHVEFIFRPRSVYAGVTVSCVTLLALMIVLLKSRPRNRSFHSTAVPVETETLSGPRAGTTP